MEAEDPRAVLPDVSDLAAGLHGALDQLAKRFEGDPHAFVVAVFGVVTGTVYASGVPTEAICELVRQGVAEHDQHANRSAS